MRAVGDAFDVCRRKRHAAEEVVRVLEADDLGDWEMLVVGPQGRLPPTTVSIWNSV